MATTTATKPRSTTTRRTTKAKGPDSTTVALGAAAAGVAIGLAANVARKLAVQAPTTFAGDWDEALKAEHELALEVFDALEATTDRNTAKRSMLLANLKHMLTKHALEEENVIYPALREAGMVEAADSLNKDHGYVKQYLYELTELPKNSALFLSKVKAFRADIEKHMKEEEDTLFPELKASIPPQKTRELTAQMNKEGFKIA